MIDFLLKTPDYATLKPRDRYLCLLLWYSAYMTASGFGLISRDQMAALSAVRPNDLDASLENLREARLIGWDQDSELLWARGRVQQTATDSETGMRLIVASMETIFLVGRDAPWPQWLSRAVLETMGMVPNLDRYLRRYEWPFGPDVAKLLDSATVMGDAEAQHDHVRTAYEMWNEMAGRMGLPVAMGLTNERRTKLRHRLAEIGGLRGWRDVLGRIETSSGLRGEASNGFRAHLDWLLDLSNMTRVREGVYNSRVKSGRWGTSGFTNWKRA